MLYGPPPSWYGTPQCTSLLRLLPHDQALDKQQKGWMDGWMLCGGGNSANIISPWKKLKSVPSQVHVD